MTDCMRIIYFNTQSAGSDAESFDRSECPDCVTLKERILRLGRFTSADNTCPIAQRMAGGKTL